MNEFLGAEDAIFIIDETSVRKWGRTSVGVGRQYLGCIGKTDNGQVAVFLAYASRDVRTSVDFRLYIPEDWFGNEARCRTAGIPKDVVFRTKPQLAREMVENALRAGCQGKWLTADEAYGGNPAFLDAVDAMGLWYVAEVPADTCVWTSRPPVRRAARRRNGHGPRIRASNGGYKQVRQIGKSIRRKDWKLIRIAYGTKCPLEYEFAFIRIVEKRGGKPGRDAWLMVRRGLAQETETKYYLSNAPKEAPVHEVARVGSYRWNVEAGFKEGKGQTKLDEYECRCWNSYHHHTVLAMVAHAFLTRLSLEGEKRQTARVCSEEAAKA